jgi:hypothetical protein
LGKFFFKGVWRFTYTAPWSQLLLNEKVRNNRDNTLVEPEAQVFLLVALNLSLGKDDAAIVGLHPVVQSRLERQ